MNETQNVLDSMMSGIVARKDVAATRVGLTLIKGEAPPLSGKTAAPFPHDDSQIVRRAVENVTKYTKAIRAELDLIDENAAALTALYGEAGYGPGGGPPEPKADTGDSPRAEFEARFNQMREEAQAQVFETLEPVTAMPALTMTAPSLITVTWACPTHGPLNTQAKQTRKGRPYHVCRLCPEFERT